MSVFISSDTSNTINKLIKTPEIQFNVVTQYITSFEKNNYYFYGMKNATTDLVTSFFIVVINKVKLLGYILSLVTLTRYTMYYHTHVANSDFYIAHYFV